MGRDHGSGDLRQRILYLPFYFPPYCAVALHVVHVDVVHCEHRRPLSDGHANLDQLSVEILFSLGMHALPLATATAAWWAMPRMKSTLSLLLVTTARSG